MKRFIIFLLLLGFVFSACAQGNKSYRIEVNLTDLKDSTLLLGYHYGDKKFIADTATLDANGRAVFSGDSLLHGGMYIIVLPQRSYFDVLVGDNQNFSLTTSTQQSIEDLTFEGSPENTAFADYQRFMSVKQREMGELRAKLREVENNPGASEGINKQISVLDAEVHAYWDRVIEQNPGTFLANILQSFKPLEFPEFQVPEGIHNADSLKWVLSYQYNQKHFFDNFNLSDDRFIRTPFFQARLETYFDKVLIPVPDTIILYADKLIERVEDTPEMARFIISQLFTKYQNAPIMGMDAVFVHLAEKYYLSGNLMQTSESLKKRISDRVGELKPNLIGEIAPNLKMRDIENNLIELHQIKSKVTIVYFWEPDCSFCKKVTPQLKSITEKFSSADLSVFSVYTQGEQKKWQDYVKKNDLAWVHVWDPYRTTNYHKLYDIYATPVIYILDAEKRIVAKRIGIDAVERFVEEELQRQ